MRRRGPSIRKSDGCRPWRREGARILPVRAPAAPAALPAPLLALFQALPRAGAPEPGSGQWVQGKAGSRHEGTEVLFHLQFSAEGTVSDVRFQAFGCPHTLATAAWVAARLPGRSRTALVPGSPLAWAEALQVPAAKLGRLLRIEDALRDAATKSLEEGVRNDVDAT